MKVSVPLENGYLADQYSKYAAKNQRDANGPIISFPITVQDLPTNTKTWGLTLLDFDAVPVSGFPWIHWLATNISATTTQLPANASRDLATQFVQGKNSLASPFIDNTDQLATERYTGPTPPDKTHHYQLTVYALDKKLALTNGYWLNEFYHAIQNHILAEAQIDLPSRA
ncbi:YbhB/YbcL family Raf kinase inhibitor-like protein [Loigolactobacillus rennini]|uniref:PEBP family protein n=1 Tax=Loigolactobacillus rennini DSM 20253 TaxID=1423796 RepID=A0A0R2D5P5_9LACO|nr:YbhB/YbcL family Raf kinase inhibitor-like protein [Loigolactobacillus rennini]KRM99233.1 PEBP family protein [Loigolactobacillus rennini DSM 20253]